MRLQWLQDEDGTYFRNMPLNLADRERELDRFYGWHVWSAHRNLLALEAEAKQIRVSGLRRRGALPKGDTVVGRKPFRESHPYHPATWKLDERETGT